MIAKKILIIIAICLMQFSPNNSYAVEPDEILKDQEQEFRARKISKNIRCMVCQNQSIDESNAPLAKDLRILIRNKIKSGSKDAEIYKFLRFFYEVYPEFVVFVKNCVFCLLRFCRFWAPALRVRPGQHGWGDGKRNFSEVES